MAVFCDWIAELQCTFGNYPTRICMLRRLHIILSLNVAIPDYFVCVRYISAYLVSLG